VLQKLTSGTLQIHIAKHSQRKEGGVRRNILSDCTHSRIWNSFFRKDDSSSAQPLKMGKEMFDKSYEVSKSSIKWLCIVFFLL